MDEKDFFIKFAKEHITPSKVKRTILTSREMNRKFRKGLTPSRKALAKTYDAVL